MKVYHPKQPKSVHDMWDSSFQDTEHDAMKDDVSRERMQMSLLPWQFPVWIVVDQDSPEDSTMLENKN